MHATECSDETMDFLKILDSIEEVLYRMALWIVLVPRTLWFILSRPGQIFSYIESELDKEPDKRFEEYISPVLLWVLVALVPHMMLLDLLANLPDSRVASESLWIEFMNAPWSTRLLVVSVVALAGPLGFSVRSLRRLSIPLNRNTLRLPFMIHCYCFTPAYVALLPIVYFALRHDSIGPGAGMWIASAAWLMTTGWLVIAESSVLASHLAISRIQAVGKVAVYLAYVVLLLFLLELAVLTIFHGVAIWGTAA